MKKHHILLVVVIVGIAAFFLNESRNLQNAESTTREELNLLREAVKKSTGASTASTNLGRKDRQPAIDSAMFISDLADVLKNSPGAETQKAMQDFQSKYEAQLTSAPVSKLKEICEQLEKKFTFGQADSEVAGNVWLAMLGLASKSDPAWAFATFDKATAAAKAPIDAALGNFKLWPSVHGESMSLTYAAALQKWLDAAQASGRIEEGNPVVAELRTQIAAAQGDQSTVMKQIAKLPSQSQRKAASEYIQGLQTPEAQRQALEELGTAQDAHHFPAAVQALVDQQGFDAARAILSSASLTPEKHDLAAATIAGAKIGPETKDRAAWLLENLRSDDPRALDQFAKSWTERNYADAANWISTIQPGPRRDAALKGFIPTAALIDGATAMDWALTVSDPYTRTLLYCEAHMKWEKTDPEQANQYQEAHPLDMEAVKAASK